MEEQEDEYDGDVQQLLDCYFDTGDYDGNVGENEAK